MAARLQAAVGVQRGAAEGGKVAEGANEGRVGLALGVNDLLEAAAQIGDLLLEVGDRLIPVLVDGLGVGEEGVDHLEKVLGVGEIGGAEEVEERLADGGFAGDVVLIELGEGVVVSPNELVSWLEAGLLDARYGEGFSARPAAAPEE